MQKTALDNLVCLKIFIHVIKPSHNPVNSSSLGTHKKLNQQLIISTLHITDTSKYFVLLIALNTSAY